MEFDHNRDFYEIEYERDLKIAVIPQQDDFMYGQVLRQITPYLRPNAHVLDLGCNTGNLSLYMARQGCKVYGIDIARNAVESAKISGKFYKIDNVCFESTDFGAWDKPEVFDFILCNHVIEHIESDRLWLQKIFMSLKRGGKLVLITPSVYSSFFLINKLFLGRCKFDKEVGHLRRYSLREITNLVTETGFTITRTVFLDGILRDWFVVCKPLRVFNRIWSRRYIRNIFNRIDSVLANFLFPASICLHCGRTSKMTP